jgi:hypothetical protein
MAGPLKVARPPQDQVMLPHEGTSDWSTERNVRDAAGRAIDPPFWSGWTTDPTYPVAAGHWPVLAGAGLRRRAGLT